MTEAQLQEKIIKNYSKRGIFCFPVAGRGRRGFPDLVAAYRGAVVFIELKSPKGTGRLDPLQAHTIEEMRSQGATVYVINSIAEAEQIAEGLTDTGAERGD